MEYDELMSMYRDSLRDKRGVLERLWARLRAPDGGDDTVAALRRCLHQLAGSAGAYGFEILGENARRVERALGDWEAQPPASRSTTAALGRRHVGDFEEVTHALELAIGTESA